ncbi:TetR/AcrR family transcriptional regulator [Nitratireductor soli]|uniref:TetR/AcrR family transcriptional regulator n=1 Tax=Nitratireductor soli TaxID=1670619 RepID=UPI00065E46CD|nr:TetR/AcrR family transcriptional regulator [Nitratireductor soli]
MSNTLRTESAAPPPTRRRLSRQERLQQLLDVGWRIVRQDGTEALTLGHLAEQAGVTKPVVYDHFGTRAGLLAALYQDYDSRQTALMDAALAAGGQSLAGRANVIASSYVDCVLLQGREIPGVIAALAGSRELETIKRAYHVAFIEKCRAALSPFTEIGAIGSAGLWAVLGAAEALSYAAATGEITASQAKHELFETIVAVVVRSGHGGNSGAGKLADI